MKVHLVLCRGNTICAHETVRGAQAWVIENTAQCERPEPLSWFINNEDDGIEESILMYYVENQRAWIPTGYSVISLWVLG